MKTTRILHFGSAAVAAFALNTNVQADDLAAAAAKASAEVNRPIVPSTHRGDSPDSLAPAEQDHFCQFRETSRILEGSRVDGSEI